MWIVIFNRNGVIINDKIQYIYFCVIDNLSDTIVRIDGGMCLRMILLIAVTPYITYR